MTVDAGITPKIAIEIGFNLAGAQVLEDIASVIRRDFKQTEKPSLAPLADAVSEQVTSAKVSDIKKKKTTAKKVKEEPVEEVAPTVDLGDETPTETVDEELTVEKHIIPAFKNYSLKHGREAAGKILKSFGTTSVRALKPEQLPLVMEALAI